MKYFEEIAKRLNGQMTKAEEEAFDRKLKMDKELAKAYELQVTEEDVLDFAIREDILTEVKTIGRAQSLQRGKTIRLTNWRNIATIAAGLALLVAAFFVFRNNDISQPPLAIAQEYFNKYPPNLSSTKSADENLQEMEQNKLRIVSPNPAELGQAIDYFETHVGTNVESFYYLGHAYWQAENHHKAQSNFQDFLNRADNNNQLRPLAEFYQSLTVLANGDTEKAKRYILENKQGHAFQVPWEALLEALE